MRTRYLYRVFPWNRYASRRPFLQFPLATFSMWQLRLPYGVLVYCSTTGSDTALHGVRLLQTLATADHYTLDAQTGSSTTSGICTPSSVLCTVYLRPVDQKRGLTFPRHSTTPSPPEANPQQESQNKVNVKSQTWKEKKEKDQRPKTNLRKWSP
jgi:hypothetical protein